MVQTSLKLTFLALFIIVFSSFVSASLTTGNEQYLSFDDTNLSGSNPLDISGNGLNGTNIGTATTGVSGILNEAFDYDGTNDYVTSTNPLASIGTGDFSICGWFNVDDVTSSRFIFSIGLDGAGDDDRFSLVTYNTGINLFSAEDSSSQVNCIGSASNISTDYNFCAIKESGNIMLFRNNILLCNETASFDLDSADWQNNYDIGQDTNNATRMDGIIDEYSVWSRALNSSEREDFYNGGIGFNPYSITPSSIINESIETSVDFQQIGSAIIGGGTTTIFSGDFIVPVNDSNLYVGVVSQVLSNQNNVLFCEIIINGTVHGNLTRNNINSEFGVSYTTTQNITLDSGSYTLDYECVRNGAGTITISETDGTIHLLIDENNLSVNYEFNNVDKNVDSNSFVEIDSFLFTVNDSIESDGIVQTIILDWDAEYENIGVSNTLINTYIDINGTSCTSYPRNVGVGSIGSVGGDCLLVNVTNGSVLNISVFALGNDSNINMNIHTKNFYSHITQTNDFNITDLNVTSSSFSKIGNFTVEIDSNHGSADIFVKAGIPISDSLIGADTSFFFNITGSSQVSETYIRTIDENIGVLIIQHQFDSLSSNNYSVELWGDCDNPICEIKGGSMIGYVTNTVDIIPNAFNISAFDNFDNSSILNFSVTDGATFTTTMGSLLFFTNNLIENLTVSSDNYFNTIILNHNSSLDLNVSLNQTLINWNCIEKVSDNNLTCTTPLESQIFNYNVLSNPNSQSLNVSGYFENIKSFNVSALQNNTLNATFYSTNQSFTTTSLITGSTPNNCTYNISSLDYNFFESKSTTTTNITDIGLINGSYNVTVDCTGFAINTVDFIVENITQTLNINLFTTNSVNLTFYDTNTGLIMNTTNITIQFIGSTAQTNITSTGNLYVDLFNPSSYTILFSADNYRQGSYIFTLDDRENIQIPLFMELENDTELVLISVIEKYSKDPIQNAIVTIQKYKNDAWITDQIVSTDFQGFTEAYFVLSTQFYNFVVEFEDQTFFGTINSNTNKKTIFAEDVTNGISIEIDTSPTNTVPIYQSSYDIIADVRYNNVTNSSGFFIFVFDDTNNLPREVVLNVTSGGVVVCSNTVTSESGNLNCAVNVSLGDVELFIGIGFVRLGDEWVALDVYTTWIGIDETITFDWNSTGIGYILSFFLVLIAFLLFAKIPSMSILSGTIAFSLLIFFRVIFNGLNLGLLTGFLFAAYLLSRIPSKGGVNA